MEASFFQEYADSISTIGSGDTTVGESLSDKGAPVTKQQLLISVFAGYFDSLWLSVAASVAEVTGSLLGRPPHALG